jgi:hypothetical protein
MITSEPTTALLSILKLSPVNYVLSIPVFYCFCYKHRGDCLVTDAKMKNKLPLIIFSLILSACGAMPQSIVASLSTQALAVGTPTVNSAATLRVMGTALVDAQGSEREAQLKIDALNRLNVDATVTHEANQMAIAAITERAHQVSIIGTQTSIPLTTTAFPVVATMQSDQIKREAAQMTNVAAQPTLEWARARADKADETIALDLAVKIAFAAMLISIAMLCGLVAYFAVLDDKRKEAAVEKQVEKTKQDDGLLPLPAVSAPETEGDNNQVPCTVDQLVEIADGVITGVMTTDGVVKKTLAFRRWGNSPNVYKVIKNIREWMLEKEFVYKLEGKLGELEFTDDGRDFLEEVVNLREPPAPYVCLPYPTVSDVP